MPLPSPQPDLHHNSPLYHVGPPIAQARLVVVAIHGRFGAPDDILKFADPTGEPDVAWLAPKATGGSWLPESFLAPLAENEPNLTSALNRITAITDDLKHKGIPPNRVVLLGFSQGACLVLEHAARFPTPWRAVIAMSGGLLGTDDCDAPPSDALNGYGPKAFDYNGDLTGLPIHIGCHLEDPLIPNERVRQSAKILAKMGAKVSVKTNPGTMHGVLPGDLAALRQHLSERRPSPSKQARS